MLLSSRLNQSGMTLLSVLIASAVLGALLTSLSRLVVWQMKAVGHTTLKADLNSLKSLVTDRISGGIDCELTTAFCDDKTPAGTVIPLIGGLASDGSPILRIPIEGITAGRFRVKAVCVSDAGKPSFNFRVGPSSVAAGAGLVDPLTSRNISDMDLLPAPRAVCGGGAPGGQTPEQICTSLGGQFLLGKCQGLGGNAAIVGLTNPDANGDKAEDGLKPGINADQAVVKSCLSNGIQLFADQTGCDSVTPFARDWSGNVILFPVPVPTFSTCYFRQEICPKILPKFLSDALCTAGPDGKLYLKFPQLPEYRSAGVAGKPMRGWSMGGRWCTGGVLAAAAEDGA